MSETWTTAVRNLVLPQFCRTCNRRLLTEDNGYFCPACWGLARRVERPFCSICGTPHQGSAGFGEIRNFPCADCRSRRKTSALDRTFGAAYYEGAVAEAVKLLKFRSKLRLVPAMAEIMIEFARNEMDLAAYDDIVPVPLHNVRHRERGFNQSAVLADELAPHFPNAVVNESLKRIRPTRIQKNLTSSEARWENVIGAFAVDRNQSFEGRCVLLIDDVVTSGGTIEECARAVQRAGAARVDAFVFALALRRFGIPLGRG